MSADPPSTNICGEGKEGRARRRRRGRREGGGIEVCIYLHIYTDMNTNAHKHIEYSTQHTAHSTYLMDHPSHIASVLPAALLHGVHAAECPAASDDVVSPLGQEGSQLVCLGEKRGGGLVAAVGSGGREGRGEEMSMRAHKH